MRWKGLIIRKKDIKKLSKILVFILITALPFITITSTIGMDTFLDSFQNPESYVFLKTNDELLATEITEPSFIIIQRANHPDFKIQKNDKIMYSNFNGEISCNKIEDIQKIGFFEKIKIKEQENNNEPNIIYKNQIIGKIVEIVDENPWNTISLRVWSGTIENLNVNALFR